MMIFSFVVGLVIGSFLGALTYRLPREISIAKGRSVCPNCKSHIKWFDNIPLISYLILRGKCRNCKTQISMRYFLIELTTAITFVVIGLNVFNLIIASILIAIFVIDLEHQIIPDVLVFIGILVAIIFHLEPQIYSLLLAGFLSAILLLGIHLATKGKGMGLGDVKLAILMGILTGMDKFLVWLFFSFVSGGIVGIILLVTGKAGLKHKIAFGPFLIIGLVLTNLFGQMFLKFLLL